ncbi:ABC-type metal ion transport system, ATPase component [Saccharomonospora viridis DSM 43017]|uniref:ABC-type metal ion transport system, ATPase component n=1 Tax=Saccharomonospora viridis (strain ATCC 15386 / DSM 43017 / JCM 3036 / CCUG 5913 / NBRC 12207 / NCIMB 9602 / P101) TaxID=471857 RepID=C7MZI7_SACVD|nr:ABC-type metal ion transport system, ATPase component [Saccharomonospora viridis DSM 43017]
MVITVENVSKSFPGTTAPVVALRDATLSVSAGSLFGILGPARSGKTTLARCVALRERPDRGVVRYDGMDTSKLTGRRLWGAQRQVGVVNPALRPERTVAGNVAAPLEHMGVEPARRKQRVGELLDVIGLSRSGARLPSELSPGQQRRVAVARALATAPSVLFADDPTAGVHGDESAAVLSVLDRARAELGATVVITTRDADVARRVCDEVALLDRGTVVESGTLLGLLGKPGSQLAEAVLPPLTTPRAHLATYDRAVDVVLVGFAAVGALLPEASARFDVDFTTIGGGLTRLGDTPVARFRLGVEGQRADAALAWIAERGAHVSTPMYGLRDVAA